MRRRNGALESGAAAATVTTGEGGGGGGYAWVPTRGGGGRPASVLAQALEALEGVLGVLQKAHKEGIVELQEGTAATRERARGAVHVCFVY